MKLSEKIIKLRKEKGLSQEEFGNVINVSRQAVSKWENEESKPDIDKIQEIVKKFDISYEYLLNDEIENEVDSEPKNKIIENKPKKNKLLKIIFIILFIYLLICIYKFIAFYRFYLIANSFQEPNYWMDQNVKSYSDLSGRNDNSYSIMKVGNVVETRSYTLQDTDSIKDEGNPILVYDITYTDIDKKIYYTLYYNKDEDKYDYRDNTKTNDEDLKKHFEIQSENLVKNNTLNYIPSGFKQILLSSINPLYYKVSIINREISIYLLNGTKIRISLTKDYLVQNASFKYENGGSMYITFSYDYVQEHFKEIEEPLILYKDKILYE